MQKTQKRSSRQLDRQSGATWKGVPIPLYDLPELDPRVLEWNHGFSRTQLAEVLGVSISAANKWFLEKSITPSRPVRRLAAEILKSYALK